MYLSGEIITTLAAVAGLLVALAGGFGCLIRRSDAQFGILAAKIHAQGSALSAKIDAQSARLDEKIEGVQRELVEVKIAIARIEGPQPRFITA